MLLLKSTKHYELTLASKNLGGRLFLLAVHHLRTVLFSYALTIHKAQGSGAKRVYVLEPKDHGLAYTAVSRAKQELFFVDCYCTIFIIIFELKSYDLTKFTIRIAIILKTIIIMIEHDFTC